MAYDGVVTYAAVKEFRDALIAGKIEKIYQPQPEQLLLIIHTQNGKRRLFISSAGNHAAMYFVDETPENPEKPPLFCMVLRKHLSAARIYDIVQHENDRIIEIFLESVNEMGFNVNKKLVIEIMGKHSNVMLVEVETNKIIDSIKHISLDVNRARQILPGKLYEYPPEQEKKPFTQVTIEDMETFITDAFQPERNIMKSVQGISPTLALTLVSDTMDSLSSIQDVSYNRLRGIIESIDTEENQPVVYVHDGIPNDFHITPLSVYEDDESYSRIDFDTFSEAAAFFFRNRESSNTVKQKSNDLRRVIKGHVDKLNLKSQRLNEDLYKAENADIYRLYGELLTANLHMAKQGAKTVTVINYYDNEPLEIPLDSRFSPAKNAQNYYKKYGKLKTAIKEKKIQLEEVSAETTYLDSVTTLLDNAKTVEEVELIRAELVESGYVRQRGKKQERKNRKAAKPRPHSYTLSSGKRVLVGRNNTENDWLTLKKASGSDLWLHTKDIPGTHVILFLEGQQPTEEELFEAAAIAAYHSKGQASENVPVDYTKVRYVKKPNGAKPGMVIFTHNKTLYVNPALPEAKQ